jgi:hypothetical protein
MPAPINYLMDVQSPIQAAVQGLQLGTGVQNIIAQREQAQAQAEQQRQMQTDLGALAANPNPTARDYAAVMAKYPQLSEQYKRTYDVMNAEQQQNKLSQATQVYAALQADQPEIAQQLLNEQATAARNSGLEEDAKAAETMAKLVELNPATAKTTMGLGVTAILGPEKFSETFKTILPEAAGVMGKVGAQQILPDGTIIQSTDKGPRVFAATGEELKGEQAAAGIRKAQAYGIEIEKLKTAGREAGKLETGAELGFEAASAKEAGKLAAQLKLKPEVESAVARAINAAKAMAEQAGAQRSNQNALNVYETAMSGIIKSFDDTWTGPILGRLPAVTSNQQIAQGAVAAMAPVLKQIFRTAGEGTFTDNDQRLLLEMVPTRKDNPDARKAKIDNIDAIVKAKLGTSEPPTTPTTTPTPTQTRPSAPSPAQRSYLRFAAPGP